MHTTISPKGVLKPKEVNSFLSTQQSASSSSALDNVAAASRGKRAFSSESGLPSTILNQKKSLSPAKMACLCAPTTHAGSFRCRFHRVTQKHWGGRPFDLTSKSKASSSSILPAIENSVGAGASARTKAFPVNPPGSTSKVTVTRPSRLRMVVVAAHNEEAVSSLLEDAISPVLNEGSVKYMKVAATSGLTSTVGATEVGALSLRVMNNSS